MKRNLILALTVLLIFTACSSGGSDSLTKEDLKEKIEEASVALSSVESDGSLTVDVTDQDTQAITIITKILYENKEVQSLFSEVANTQGKVLSYSENGKWYMNQGDDWIEIPNENVDIRSTYYPILQSLLDAYENLEMSMEDDMYLLSFKGKNADVYQALQYPFSITFGDYPNEEVEMDILFKVDADGNLHSINESFKAEDDTGSASIKVNVDFSNHNGFDSIDKPEGME